MHLQRLKLRYEVTGKLPSARVKTSYLMSEDVNVPVEVVDLNAIDDGIDVLRKLDGTVETIKVRYDRFYIRNDVRSDADRQLRASAFLIPDYKVAEALGEFSTFEVLHYNDAKLLQQDVLTELPIDLRESNFDTVRVEAYESLLNEAHQKLILADDVVYMEAGDPVICLRLVKGNLQVFFAFRQSEIVVTGTPVIMLSTYEHHIDDRELDDLIDIFKANSDGQVIILSEVASGGFIQPKFDYSYKKELLTLAQNFVQDANEINKWNSDRISAWTRLRDDLKAYQAEGVDGDLFTLSEAVVAYSKHINDIDIRLYALMLHDLIMSRYAIDLSKLVND